jgi:hypothetical protein
MGVAQRCAMMAPSRKPILPRLSSGGEDEALPEGWALSRGHSFYRLRIALSGERCRL